MSVLNKIKSSIHHLPHGTAPKNFMGLVVDKGERLGGAFACGALKGYYGERFLYKGHGLDLWGGVALAGISVVLNVMSGGRSKIADHTERLSDVGLMSALGSLGATYGMQKAGRAVQVLSPGKNTRGIPGAKQTMLGYIAPAMGGSYLTPDDIANYATRR